MLPAEFISATEDYSTYTDHVPAPYLRKSFTVSKKISAAKVIICGLGFYRLFINGREITKGLLAPYISNPDDILYYDCYDITPFISHKNALGIILGNGILNCTGGRVWEFDKAEYRDAPKAALRMEITYDNGETESIVSDTSFKVHPSPILFDDLRCGEIYDARLETDGWSRPDFDDSGWKNAVRAKTPKGEPRICTAENIVTVKTLSPVSVTKSRIADIQPSKSKIFNSIPMDKKDKEGYLYDFGENSAGVIRLRIKGRAGQRISVQTGELLTAKGELNISGMRFQPEALDHRIIYTCKGEGTEEYVSSFTYFGMRYCLVSGITEEQATADLLTFEIKSSKLKKLSDFHCSDEIANRLQKAAYNSNISNFYYFPTDCPHREKNGWTGDAALSAEQMLLMLSAENSLSVWLDNIRKAQRDTGELPGIIPTAGWGFCSESGTSYNGPAWDCALVQIPYYIWLYRGNTAVISDNAASILKYLRYIASKRDKRGVIEVGLWDYLPIGYRQPRTPIVTSDTLITMDTCQKCIQMFDAIGFDEGKEFAHKLREELRAAARVLLIEADGATVLGRCQSAQAMGLAYGLFDQGEQSSAFDVLLRYIRESDDRLDTGILGARVIFDILSQFGHSELAYYMITRPEYPSYGHWILSENCTALFESFKVPDSPENQPGSKNHHFMGHITAWFLKYIAGIKINPYARDIKEIEISPNFISGLTYAKGYHNTPFGKLKSEWERMNGTVKLTVTVPENCYGLLRLPEKYVLREKFMESVKVLTAGTTVYTVFEK